MNYRQDNQDDTWAGLIPEQPEEGLSTGVWLVIAGGVFILLCLCVGGGFLLYNEFVAAPTEEPPPVVPTIAGEETPGDSPATVTDVPPTTEPDATASATPTTAANPTVTLPAGSVTVTTPPTSSNVEAVRLAAPPTIDGNLSEWGETPTYPSAFRVFNAQSWDGTEDLTAVWRLAWDNTNLYIGVEVTDDTHVQSQTGNQLFRGDSVDMQFDTDRGGDLGDGLSPDDFQITFSPGNFGSLPPSAFRFQGTENGRILDAPGGNNVTVDASQTAAGYILEAAIPWSDLNLTPSEGLVIGIALNASDNDSPGTAVQEVMMSHVSTRTLTDPRGWGTLTLR